MSWTIQKPPNPIIIDDSGNQVSGTSVVWVYKNNTVITNTSVISQPSADTWLAPSGTEFSSETQNQQMQSANWDNSLITLTWDGQNFTDTYSSNQYDEITMVFETNWS